MTLLAGVVCLGAVASTATAGKKKGTKVVIDAGSVLSGQQNVKVKGSLNTATACRGARSMRLFVIDQNGNVEATIDSGTSSAGGNWTLKAKLENPPTAEQFLQVKAKKLSAGKYVCKAGLSKAIAIQ
ncbi:MAG: hypothetical protein FJW90_04135 [Actinobacteria bacterium]|nr:hypothetical protein [Actinomycetota bacterium]